MILLSSLVQATDGAVTNDMTGIWHENQRPVGCRWLPTNDRRNIISAIESRTELDARFHKEDAKFLFVPLLRATFIGQIMDKEFYDSLHTLIWLANAHTYKKRCPEHRVGVSLWSRQIKRRIILHYSIFYYSSVVRFYGFGYAWYHLQWRPVVGVRASSTLLMLLP